MIDLKNNASPLSTFQKEEVKLKPSIKEEEPESKDLQELNTLLGKV
jgi:hypothetical protein